MSDIIGTIALLFVLLTTGVVLWQSRRLRKLEVRLAAFLQGRDGQTLEGLLTAHALTIEKHAAGIDELRKASEYLHRALQAAIRKVAFERYNPFPGLGGNQSFTLVLLDAHNTGVVFTSLHNREATRVYAKSVRDGKPLQQLSEEEDRVLRGALLQKGA